jgi:hypothetical protein
LPCFHGYNNAEGMAQFNSYSRALLTLRESYDEALARHAGGSPSQMSPGVDAVRACQSELPMTSDFAMFVLSAAVDALVDGDPRLPPSDAPSLAQMGIMIERLVEENTGRIPQFATPSEGLKYRFRDIARIDAGDDVIQYLHPRIDCCCLKDKEFCAGCHSVVPAGQLKRCAQCKVAVFCSRECQKNSWKGHQKNCQKIKQLVDVGFLS